MARRHTLARAIPVEGVGLHGGRRARVTLHPAAPGAGLVFALGPEQVPVPATADHVVSTRSATTLGWGSARLATVEHLLAALLALAIDDARIEVDGEELPALDGCAAEWVRLLRGAGRVPQSLARDPLRLRRSLELSEGTARIRAEPAPALRITCAIDFPHPALGSQRVHVDALDPETFAREIAPARTFGFARDAETMRRAGLAAGVDLDNTVVFDDEKPLNPGGLRWPDEPCRHKALDLIGDLALLGRPLEAHVTVERGTHALHLALVRALEAR
ncbi:MAG: UDP-3-O-acyl-N-acetylglucosamine deacetylase [Myxococcota bacterium]|nr:UDP-3-O-acyl-N-acetylglucosamine deacetylase [Myxococcota bacterium]